MLSALASWLAFWLVFAVVDIIAARYGVSLSATARWAFHTESKFGAFLFTAFLTAGFLALLHHIIFGGK